MKLDKEKLIEKDIKSIENRVRHAYNQGYEAGLKHGKEQDTVPFDFELYQAGLMDAPEGMIEVLDAIKAEVIRRDRNVKTVRSDGRCLFTAEEILEIIDNYRRKTG